MVSACLPSPSLRNLLTCPVAMSSAEHAGKGMLCLGLVFELAWGTLSLLSPIYVCFFRFLNLKIQEGEAHNIFCPAFDCYQQVPVEVIESVVSREMDRRFLQFDIKVERSKKWTLADFYIQYRIVKLSYHRQRQPHDSCSLLLRQRHHFWNRNLEIFEMYYLFFPVLTCQGTTDEN